MDWTKIPTDLITNRTPDNEILAIVKYQLLWAELERQPDDKVALRYMTAKQLANAQQWLTIITAQVTSDIHSAEKNRTKRKINYNKIKSLDKNVSGTTTDTIPSNVSSSVLTKRKKENKKEEINKEKQYLLFNELINKYPNLEEPMDRWLKYKKEKKENYTDTGLEDCIEKLNRLSGGDKNLAMAIVKQSTSNNWSGLFQLKDNYKKQPQMIIPQDMSIYDVDKDPFEV